MANVLKWFLVQGKEWSQSKLTEVDQEFAFARGVTESNTPRGNKRKLDYFEDGNVLVSPITMQKPAKIKRVEQERQPVKRRLNFDNMSPKKEKSFTATKYEPTAAEILEAKSITPDMAADLLAYAMSGNQNCGIQTEEELSVNLSEPCQYASNKTPDMDKKREMNTSEESLPSLENRTLVDSSPETVHDIRKQISIDQYNFKARMKKVTFEPNISRPGDSSENPVVL